ncbi:DJ-1/PfpI family protein [Nakamurella deserti]|uniref:DJ-1/PfpI family protein n=1 Tax=Nakamurella deserti TaxID=2164074 RepID=UPI000DBE73D8|nr:DJ-1/PfpI family protein [Nakamurella deserti]
MAELTGKTIAFLTSQHGIEEPELTTPWQAVIDAGGTPVLIAPEAGEVSTVNNDLEPSEAYPVDRVIADADIADYDAVVIPGGTVNADTLRTVGEAVAFVSAAVSSRTVVAAICHGPWALVEAGAVRGRTLTSYPSLQTDVRNAGGTWVDEEVHVDDTDGWVLITSRNPDDLPAFSKALVSHAAAAS